MPSDVIDEKAENDGPWQSVREQAPSVMQADALSWPRWVALFGLAVLVVGAAIIIVNAAGIRAMLSVSNTIGGALGLVGLGCLLFHAAWEKDVQIRRMYGLVGFLWVVLAILAAAVPFDGKVLGFLLPFTTPALFLGLLFLTAYSRNETDPGWRRLVLGMLGVVGASLAGIGLVGGAAWACLNAARVVSTESWVNFMIPYGLVLSMVGLAYLWAFVTMQGSDDPLSYRVGTLVGIAAFLAFAASIGSSLLPIVLVKFGWLTAQAAPIYMPSASMVLLLVSIIFMGLALGTCSDRPVVVLTKRELASYFYSPIAYFVLFCWTFLGWIVFGTFVGDIYKASQTPSPWSEPIVRFYVGGLWVVIFLIFVVPILTMRLLSEEKRTATLEVLLTAPVNDLSIVFSKFLGALVFFLIIWVPWGLFLVALRVLGREAFDYGPLLSFLVALVVTGASFVSMGLFFSAITRNQIVAAILTFVGMVLLTFIVMIQSSLTPGSPWQVPLTYMSYLELWGTCLQGTLAPRLLLFPISTTIFWLFMTTKVMEARKWW